MIGLVVVSISNAQFSKALRELKDDPSPVDFTLIRQKAVNLLHSVPASSDTIVIPGGKANAGLMESIINGDVTAGNRTNINRVYVLQADSLYIQYAGLNVVNPTGVLTIVGAPGGTKPVILPQTKNGVSCGMNLVEGSIKLRNLYWESQLSDGSFNNNNFVGSSDGVHAQFVDCDNCVFEFINLDTFSCDGYTTGAKFRFTNCYFRNLFNSNEWWGGRVFDCKQWIDTVWVENVTVTGGGLTFLQQNSLCKFAYYNHNTIINNNKYWLTGVYYLEGYWVNNLFINQNWVGEDYYNLATTGDGGGEPGMLTGAIGLDSIVRSQNTKQHIHIQPEFMNADSTINSNLVDLSHIKAFASNNVLWTDTVALRPYYKNMQVGSFGPYGTRFVDTCPASWLTWTGGTTPPSYLTPQAPPYQVVNVPSIWMNPRTAALFANHAYPGIVQSGNLINTEVSTVTPAIASAAIADQMALWDAAAWGVPGIAGNNINASAYIFGDFNPQTIPGYAGADVKTEDGNGINKFTDFQENFAQFGWVHLSLIDGLPIGSLIWDDSKLAAYNSQNELSLTLAAYAVAKAAKTGTGVSYGTTPGTFALKQNYPNPFNPSTQISYSVPTTGLVTLKVYNILGQEVVTLFSGVQTAGSYEKTFDGTKLASGVYFYHLQAGNQMLVKKMVMLK
jgi:hypothetical protein